MYAYSPALEAAAPTVFLFWLRAWVGVHLSGGGGCHGVYGHDGI